MAPTLGADLRGNITSSTHWKRAARKFTVSAVRLNRPIGRGFRSLRIRRRIDIYVGFFLRGGRR